MRRSVTVRRTAMVRTWISVLCVALHMLLLHAFVSWLIKRRAERRAPWASSSHFALWQGSVRRSMSMVQADTHVDRMAANIAAMAARAEAPSSPIPLPQRLRASGARMVGEQACQRVADTTANVLGGRRT